MRKMLQLWQVFSLAFLYTKHSEKRLLLFNNFPNYFRLSQKPQRKDKKLHIHYKPKPAAFQ